MSSFSDIVYLECILHICESMQLLAGFLAGMLPVNAMAMRSGVVWLPEFQELLKARPAQS